MDETARVNDRDPRFANFSKSHKVVIPKKSCIWRAGPIMSPNTFSILKFRRAELRVIVRA